MVNKSNSDAQVLYQPEYLARLQRFIIFWWTRQACRKPCDHQKVCKPCDHQKMSKNLARRRQVFRLVLYLTLYQFYTRLCCSSQSHWQEENELFCSAIMKCVTYKNSTFLDIWNVIKSSLRWTPDASAIDISAGTYGKCPCICCCRYIRNSNHNPVWILSEIKFSSFHL